MRICILSDSHDNRALLEAAVADAAARGAEAIIHCGDVVAPSTLSVVKKYGLPVHVIHGNNTGDLYTMGKVASEAGSVVHYHGQDAGVELAGRRIFMVHYPHYARGMAATGDWDMVCCGHDHRPAIERLPNLAGTSTLLVNPGTVGGVGNAPTYALGRLDTLDFEILPVPQPT